MIHYDRTGALHVQLEFREYVQIHEEHTNDMYERTIGGICLRPTGNNQGRHWFMSYDTGAWITHHRWTPLLMPREVIQCVNHIGQEQGMPDTLAFADHHGNELEDQLEDINDEDDDSYQPPDDATNEYSNDNFSFDGTNTHGSDDMMIVMLMMEMLPELGTMTITIMGVTMRFFNRKCSMTHFQRLLVCCFENALTIDLLFFNNQCEY